MNLVELINKKFGNQIRFRVCGVCSQNGQYLLANHAGINENGDFWCPPGGGLEFGESIENCLKREFFEETGLTITVGSFLNIFEYLKKPLHAIELFYEIKIIDGEMQLGNDPETGNEILTDLKWMTIEEIKCLKTKEIHQFFHKYL